MNTVAQAEIFDQLHQELEMSLPLHAVSPAHEGTTLDFINHSYVDILFRTPSPQEVTDARKSMENGITREQFRFALAETSARNEACLNPPLVAFLRLESLTSKDSPPLTCDTLEELLQFANTEGTDAAALIHATYCILLGRSPSPTDVDGWVRLRQQGLSPAAFLWAIVYSDESKANNAALPLGIKKLAKRLRRKAGFKELLLLDGNAFLELGCQMFLGRAASEEEQAFYKDQIKQGRSAKDALWKTVRRGRATGRRSGLRILTKSVCHPLTIGRWHVGHLLGFRKSQSACQIPAILRAIEDVRHSLQQQSQRQEDLAATKLNRAQAVSDNVLLVDHPYHGVFGIPAENWGFVRMFTFGSGFEHGTMTVLTSLCAEGMTVIDIGAHVGLQALAMVRCIGPTGRLHCFEPCQRTAEILGNNLFINGYQNATVHPIALSDQTGTAKFYVHARELTWSSLFPVSDVESCPPVDVRIARLDDILPIGTTVDVVKIDAEGNELNVLKGMQRIMRENPQVKIVMEFGPTNIRRAGVRPEELLQQIHAIGFIMQSIDEHSGELSLTKDNDILSASSVNLLLTR